MAFHFPLMPKIFLALKRELAAGIVDIVKETDFLPESCQWAIFLRNHDEMALSTLTHAERVEVLDRYAPEPRMRLNGGIRRRLAPLRRRHRPARARRRRPLRDARGAQTARGRARGDRRRLDGDP